MKRIWFSLAALSLALTSCGGSPAPTSVASVASSEQSSELDPWGDPIDIEFASYNASSCFDCQGDLGDVIYYSLTPHGARSANIVWTSSDSTIAYVVTRDRPTIFTSVNTGKVTITATLPNGVSKSFDYEVKPLLTFDSRLGEDNVVSITQYGGRTRSYKVSDLDYSWYYKTGTVQYSDTIKFKCIIETLSDSLDVNDPASDWVFRYSLIDKDGVTVQSGMSGVSDTIVGDKYREEEMLYNAPLSGAPYTLRIMPY